MPQTPAKKSTAEEKLNEKIAAIWQEEEESRAKLLAAKLNLPYINIAAIPISDDAILTLTEKESRDGEIAVIQKSDRDLKIISQNPESAAAQKIIKKLTSQGRQCRLFICSPRSLKKALDRYKKTAEEKVGVAGKIVIGGEKLARLRNDLKSIADVKKRIETADISDATGFFENIIVGALQTDVSDIHLEAQKNGAIFRYRVDGILHNAASLSIKDYQTIIARLKLMSDMTLNIHDRAQDGRFTIELDQIEIETRVSIIPGPNGENAVLRILNPKNINLSIQELGLREDACQFLKKEITRPNGMIIVTGPTGSGKTTTLYAFLKEVANPSIKLITLEDPIEYHLKGAIQTQVEAEHGYTFAAGLRAILRQDPDVVLVGEIRDKETAEIAIQAALTGHIVFSTLHTNDAAGAIPRFIDMGANPTTLSAALINILAQRLLRRICPHCREEYDPSPEEIIKIKKVLENLPKTIAAPDISRPFKLAQGKGCAQCNNTGYKGRIGVYEIIPVDAEIEKLITHSPSHAEILEVIRRKGFISMYDDGIIRVAEKTTTIAEVEDIIGSR